jgi:hypothetical protein
MFAHDLCHSWIEYFRKSIDLNRKDRATRGASACATRAIPQIFNLQSSIVNSGFAGVGVNKGHNFEKPIQVSYENTIA